MRWLILNNSSTSVELNRIPELSYAQFFEDMLTLYADKSMHCATYFGVERDMEIHFYCLMLNDSTSEVMLAMHRCEKWSTLESLTPKITAMHIFEREIHERYGIGFAGHPWLKPVRFPYYRYDTTSTINNYPFYTIDGEMLHEVNVGPIHAGIIEPGAFRFICNGEAVLNLEIALGFQHRGLENLIIESRNRLRQVLLGETIAGDSSVSHGLALCHAIEKLTPDYTANQALELERTIALELERIAMHIGDTGALCMDLGYQLGQVACEALRTMTINTTQAWCGNRFGKGLARPHGTQYPITDETAQLIAKNVREIGRRFAEVGVNLFNTPSVLSRLEDLGIVTKEQAMKVGAVGMAARSSGVVRDIRSSHPYEAYKSQLVHRPIIITDGDVMSRLKLRISEVAQAAEYIINMIDMHHMLGLQSERPSYNKSLAGNSLSFALVEGWRGEICHVMMTDADGNINEYRIKDPSLHNWMCLSLAVRGIGISEFPVYNKSFNLSYCGYDL